MEIYNYSFMNADDENVTLESYKGKVMLIVNTASKCGFTHQYKGLEKLHQEFSDQGLEVIGFPCNQFLDQEPGTAEEIKSFCELNYGVTFELSQKLDVRGESADPIFKHLVSQASFEGFDVNTEGGAKMQGFLSEKLPHLLEGDDVKWNFTKFLVNKDGSVIKRFEPTIDPEDMRAEIKAML